MQFNSQLYFFFLIGLIQNSGFTYFPFHIYQLEEMLQIPKTVGMWKS